MKYMTDINTYQGFQKTAVTLGKFDGLHAGHQELIKRVQKYAEREHLDRVVFVFNMQDYLEKTGRGHKVLMTSRERAFELEGLTDYLIEQDFTEAIRTMPAETFIEEILCRKLHASRIVVGTDFTFGYKAQGDYRMLEKYQDRFGYRLDVVEKITYQNREISSTFIREMVRKGEMAAVREMLGTPYRISGTIVNGRHLGRTIGIPTMNLPVDERKLLPPCGVYAAKGILDGKSYDGILNIGVKPTVTEDNKILAELHLFDYTGDAYGKALAIDLYWFMRKEEKFASLTELKTQVQRDIAQGKRYLSKLK